MKFNPLDEVLKYLQKVGGIKISDQLEKDIEKYKTSYFKNSYQEENKHLYPDNSLEIEYRKQVYNSELEGIGSIIEPNFYEDNCILLKVNLNEFREYEKIIVKEKLKVYRIEASRFIIENPFNNNDVVVIELIN
jgi:hypothetical protein